jgi:hypothetical protein
MRGSSSLALPESQPENEISRKTKGVVESKISRGERERKEEMILRDRGFNNMLSNTIRNNHQRSQIRLF